MRERYTLAAAVGASGVRGGGWHEIAQWYGFESVRGFSEEYPGLFARKDLYSNSRVPVWRLNCRRPERNAEDVQHGDGNALRQALTRLAARPAPDRHVFRFDGDGRWWNSQRRVPEKYLVLHRNYQMNDDRLPTADTARQCRYCR
ncbi:DUF4056 domain-containing protein [Salmonella enterica subsp. enterica]|nr:DUF4056 domain-containing protein [Salmonella enterica subsp. enterica]